LLVERLGFVEIDDVEPDIKVFGEIRHDLEVEPYSLSIDLIYYIACGPWY